MKIYPIALTLLIALPLASRAEIKEGRAYINGRTVAVRTETCPQDPAACLSACARRLEQQGWHDQMLRALAGPQAVLIYSQRDADVCRVKEVKITLWKATARSGKTVTESWVYRLRPEEVNRFLDRELPQVARQFTSAAGRSS